MKNCNFFLLIFILLGLLNFAGCDPDDIPDDIRPLAEEGGFEPGSGEIGADGRPLGWGEDTHGKNASPNYKFLFDHNEVLRLDIVIAPSDWQAMMDDMLENFGAFGVMDNFGTSSFSELMEFLFFGAEENPVYVPCDLVFKGNTWHHVGIRFKGNSSLRRAWKSGSYKLPLRLTFDKLEDDFPEIKDQRFYGFKKLGLTNNASDNSLIREKVASEVYRAAGIPVYRDAFCRLFIDYGEGKKYFGLYTLQEIPAKPMLKSVFIEADGNLYKPSGNSASFNSWNPEDFDKETNKDEADFSDVHELYTVLQSDRRNEAAFKQRLEKIFDVDGFLHYLAVNQVMCNWDTYGNVPHNYFLYHDPGDDLLHWIPVDFNFSLATVGFMPVLSLELSPTEVNRRWPLIRYLMDIDDYHAKYVYYVQKTIDEVFYPQRMQAIIAESYQLVRPYVVGNYGEVQPYSSLARPSDFDDAFTYLNTHVKDRYEAAQEFVQKYQQQLTLPGDPSSNR